MRPGLARSAAAALAVTNLRESRGIRHVDPNGTMPDVFYYIGWTSDASGVAGSQSAPGVADVFVRFLGGR